MAKPSPVMIGGHIAGDNMWWILHPKKAPPKGLYSYPDPQTLVAGQFSAMAGFRLDKGVLKVKDGDVKITSAAILAASTFRGAGTFRAGMVSSGNPQLFAGFHISNVGRIYSSSDGITFAEETAASGQFGSTRLVTSTSHDPWFYMQAVNNRFIPDSNYGVLGDTAFIINHHGNAPRVYSALYDTLGVHDEISVPQGTQILNSIPTMGAYFLVNTTAQTTHSQPTGTSIANADAGTTPNNYLTVTATNPTLNDIARTTFSTSMSLGTAGGVLTSRQLVMLLESPTPDILDKYTIRIGDGTNRVVIYDPTSSTKNQPPTITPADSGGRLFWAAFSLDTIDGTTAPALNAITEVDFLWAKPTETATYVLYVYAIMGSGKAPGGRKHYLTYFRRKLMCESRGLQVLSVQPELISNLGGPGAITGRIPGGMRIPSIDYRVYVNYKLYYQNPTAAELDKGTDMLVIYGQDVGEKWYSWVTSDTIGTFLGTWSFSSGSALGIRTVTDNILDKNLSARAPTPDTLPIPNGKAMCYANGRLFVAARPQGSLGYSTVYVSDEGYPGRMREAARTISGPTDFDPTSGTTHQLEDEDVMNMVSTPGAYQGTSNVYIFTNKNVWMVGRDVNRIERVATIGTLSPMSVVEYEGSIFFLDSNRRVQWVRGGEIKDITTGVVQDVLESIPGGSDVSVSRLYRVTGSAWKNYFRLGLGTTGSTNTRCLVYDILRGEWIANEPMTLSNFTVEQFITWEKAGIVGLYAFSSDLEFYQYEQPASTANASVSLTTGEVYFEDWSQFALNRIGFVATDIAQSLTTSRYFYPGTGTPTTATVNLNVATDRAWKFDAVQGTTGDKVGRTAKVTISGTLAGGTSIYEIMAEVASRGSGASR